MLARSVTINFTIYVCNLFDSLFGPTRFPILPRIRFISCRLACFPITLIYMGNYYIPNKAITCS